MLSVRSRRTMFAAACLSAGTVFVTACTSSSSDTRPPAATAPVTAPAARPTTVVTTVPLRTIHPAPASPAAAAAPAADGAMRFARVHYTWAGPDTGLPATGAAYIYAGDVTDTQAARLAAAFDIPGDPVRQPVADGGGWTVGPNDGSAATLWVSSTGLGEWTYSTPMTAVPCTVTVSGGMQPPAPNPADSSEPATAPAPDSTPSTAGTGTTGEGTVTPGTVIAPAPGGTAPMPACDGPITVTYPPAEQMIADATRLATAAGLPDTMTFTADPTSGTVTATELIGGVPSPFTEVVQFASDGTVQWASGHFAAPVDAGRYPLVDLHAAVTRANDQSLNVPRGAEPFAGLPAAANDEPQPLPSPAGSGVDTSSSAPVPMPADPPVTDPAGEPVELTLTGVTVSVTPIWDADGSVWMVPAFVFSGADGVSVTVPAVTDDYLPVISAPSADATGPVTAAAAAGSATGSGIAAPARGSAPAVVGLDETSARETATKAGWALRVVRVDGEDLVVTADYSDTRLSVTVEHGVVVAATVG